MKRLLKSAVIVTLALTLAALPALAQGPRAGATGARPGGERRGGMMNMMYLEQSWAALTFEIGISADQISKLRPTYQAAWKSRAAAMKTAMQKRDFQSASSAATKIKASLDGKIKAVLSKSQMAAWTKWQAEQQKRFQRRGPGAH